MERRINQNGWPFSNLKALDGFCTLGDALLRIVMPGTAAQTHSQTLHITASVGEEVKKVYCLRPAARRKKTKTPQWYKVVC